MSLGFLAALNRTIEFEKGYISEEALPGGETFWGIDRSHNPTWAGWGKVDAWDKKGTPPDLSEELNKFYLNKYWRPIKGNTVYKKSKRVAIELFDIAVQRGPVKAIKMLQEALSLANRNQKLYTDLKIDGLFGKNTLAALTVACSYGDSEVLLNILKALKGEHYLRKFRDNPENEKCAGWFRRL